MSDEQWWIYSDGEIIGAFTVAQLYRMRNDHELPGASQFYSNRRRDWFPISGLLFDITPQVIRILTMTSVGITKCKILGAGYDDECPECRVLADRTFEVQECPELPPKNCTCIPWCRLLEIAVE